MARTRMALVFLVASLALPASAHEGGRHARGVVREVSRDRIVLAPAEGVPLTFVLAPATRIRRGPVPVSAEAIRVGERAVVHAKPGPAGLEATDVILGEATKRRAP